MEDPARGPKRLRANEGSIGMTTKKGYFERYLEKRRRLSSDSYGPGAGHHEEEEG